jgi:hypothetical protein
MKSLILIFLFFLMLSTLAQTDSVPSLFRPPIPVELMVGNKHTLFKMIVTKPINRKLKFYNLLTYEVNHADFESSIFLNQTVLFYDFSTNVSAGLGVNLKTFGGLKPVFSVLYAKFTKSIGYIIQPTVEVHKDGAKELFGMFEYTFQNQKELQPYFRVDALTTWKAMHDFSYTNLRLGLNRKGFRFGPAVNVQYFGPTADSQYNWGGFINVLIP